MANCRCWDLGLRPNMTYDELIEEIVRPEKYCTSIKERGGKVGIVGWICPTLDQELRRADADRTRRAQYTKRRITQSAVVKAPDAPEPKRRKKASVPANFKPRRKRV